MYAFGLQVGEIKRTIIKEKELTRPIASRSSGDTWMTYIHLILSLSLFTTMREEGGGSEGVILVIIHIIMNNNNIVIM
jgi:hypothetical protein